MPFGEASRFQLQKYEFRESEEHLSIYLYFVSFIVISVAISVHNFLLKFGIYSQRNYCKILQYRSKVSYHLLYRFSRDESLGSRDESLVSRDETLVSQEPLKRIFWNKLQAVSLREND